MTCLLQSIKDCFRRSCKQLKSCCYMVAMVTVQRSFPAVTKVVKMVSERSPAVTLSADKIVSYTKLSVIYIHLRLCVFAAWPLISVSKLLQISNERFFEIPPIPPFIFIKTMKIASCRKLPVIYIHLHLCIYVAWLMLTLCVANSTSSKLFVLRML